MEVVDGQILKLRVYVENSASDHLRGVNWDGEGMALETRLAVNGPIQASSLQVVTASLSSSTTDPDAIEDGVFFVAVEPFRLDYIRGSAKLQSNAFPNPGVTLSNEIWNGEGVLLGYEELDGRLAPGYQYALYVTLEVRVSVVR